MADWANYVPTGASSALGPQQFQQAPVAHSDGLEQFQHALAVHASLVDELTVEERNAKAQADALAQTAQDEQDARALKHLMDARAGQARQAAENALRAVRAAQATVGQVQPKNQAKAPPPSVQAETNRAAAREQYQGWTTARRVRQAGNAAHDPRNFEVPRFGSRLAVGQAGLSSCLLKDNRDERLLSPYQGWFPMEIFENSTAGTNVQSERSNMLVPNKGYYLNLFTIVTLGVHKFTIMITMDAPQGFPCAHWDAATARTLMHDAFKPFEWPAMTADSPPIVDVKILHEGQLCAHLQFTAFRSNEDMTLTKQWFLEDRLAFVKQSNARFQVIAILFAGWNINIIALSFEPGKRLYVAVPNGGVIAGDFPRVHGVSEGCSQRRRRSPL